MTGTAHTTTSVTTTGNQLIDGLLKGTAWNDATLYYSFPTSSAEYSYSGEPGTFRVATSMMEDAAHFALNTFYGNAANDGFSIEGFTNLNITHTASTGAHLRFAESDDPSTAWAYYPSTGSKGGDIWFGPYNSNVYRTPEAGNYAWATLLHETGHAMGLKHGHDATGNGALPTNYDSMEYSIMTYRSYVNAPLTGYTNESWGYAQSYMMADIAALQQMYGADFTTNSGDTVYKWNPNSGDTLVNGAVAIDAGGNRIFATIWDGGGNDTYDLTSYSTNLNIDLTPGGYSAFSNTQLSNLGGGNTARGNIFNALQYQSDLRSLIENAWGGSGNDTIRGNIADNILLGGAGNDVLIGDRGTDWLQGDAGTDWIYGGYDRDVMAISNGWGVDYLVDFQSGFDFIVFDGVSGLANNYQLGYNYNGATNVTTIWWAGNVVYAYDYIDQDDIRVDLNSGTTGNDSLNGTNYADSVALFAGNDLAVMWDGNDLVRGGDGNDWIYGGNGNDTLLGEDDNDYLFGGNGNDLLVGGEGYDVLYGGAGADTFGFGVNWGVDWLYDFSTTEDFVALSSDYSAISSLDLGYSYDLAQDVTSIWWGSSVIYVYDYIAQGDILIEREGTGSADSFAGTNGGDRIFTHGGDDVIWSYWGGDQIYAGSGNDFIYAYQGNDYLYGQAGNDSLYGFSDNDYLDGGLGNDALFGGTGNDTFAFVDTWGSDVVHDWEDGLDRLQFDVDGLTNTGQLGYVAFNGTTTTFYYAGQIVTVYGNADLADIDII